MALCCLGLLSVFSATRINPTTGLISYFYLERQLISMAAAIPVMILAWRTNYHVVFRRHWLIYTFNLLLLVAVLKLGHHEVKGAQRWINLGGFHLQPSEVAKIAVIISLSAFLSRRPESLRRLPMLLKSLLHVAVPALVIFKQPDLGTGLVILSIWAAMVFVGGARARHLVALLLVGVIAFGGLWFAGGVKQYQKDRVRVFLNPQSDPRGVGYHITQALDAIGSGRLWGKGIFRGSQGQLGYIPEQQTDFIFTIVGEELGFAGSAFLVVLYLLFLWRACAIAAEAVDTQGRLLATGIVAMFLYHIVVNIGMTIAIMPVTGVPLPFMSFGGSSIMANLCAVGLLESVREAKPRIAL
ncbi:MAG: rod shape-determining protein RodA [Chloroflexi bacterium]|nr:rod shape-determining protein RodA [Chloroflexota bacterium]